MARTRTFSLAAPAHGRAAEACGIDVVSPTLPRSSAAASHSKPARRGGRSFHLLARRVTPRMSAIEAGRARASEPSLVSHTSQLAGALCRAAGIWGTRLGDSTGFGVEPALHQAGQDRRLRESKL
jgi:hypothetical protein